ncbi:MAG: hypothetical protein RRY64_07455, partial [Oscillospiraceae bacterium]
GGAEAFCVAHPANKQRKNEQPIANFLIVYSPPKANYKGVRRGNDPPHTFDLSLPVASGNGD